MTESNGSARTHQRSNHPGRRYSGRRTISQRVDVERRRRFVLDMAIAGATPTQIAEAVVREGLASPKYTRASAAGDISAAIASITAVPAFHYRATMLRRLTQVQQRLMRDVLDPGNAPDDRARAANALVRAMEREARLTGIDEPVRTDIEISAHIEVVAALAADAVAAGAERAGLDTRQREALSAGMTEYFTRSVPALSGAPEVIDVEAEEAEAV